MRQRSGRDFAKDPDGESRSRKWLRKTISFGSPNSRPSCRTSSLNKHFRARRAELHLLRQAAHVVVALDHGGGISSYRHRFDDVGIQRTLREKFRFARAPGGILKKPE